MKKPHIVIIIFLGVMAAFLLNSCKYEDGPAISFRSRKERVSNTWKLDKYLVNGVDSTIGYSTYYTAARWTFNKNGGFMYSYILPDTLVSATGTWEFTNSDEAINLSYITFTDTIQKQTLTILKLKEKDFWFKRTDTLAITRELHLTQAD